MSEEEEPNRLRPCLNCNVNVPCSLFRVHMIRCNETEAIIKKSKAKSKHRRPRANKEKNKVIESQSQRQKPEPEQEMFPCNMRGHRQSIMEQDVHFKNQRQPLAVCVYCQNTFPHNCIVDPHPPRPRSQLNPLSFIYSLSGSKNMNDRFDNINSVFY